MILQSRKGTYINERENTGWDEELKTFIKMFFRSIQIFMTRNGKLAAALVCETIVPNLIHKVIHL